MKNKIRVTREALGMSREDLASRAQISFPYLCSLEAKPREPGLSRARRLAKALGVTLDELFPEGQ